MFQESQFDEHELVVPLRPNGDVVGTVSLLAFIGAMFVLPFILVFPVPSPPLSPLETGLALSAVVVGVTPALLCIFYRCHARLVLSETGLRWRTWGDWRRASWDGVQDYYDVPPHSSRDFDKLMTIQTDAGNVLLSCKRYEREAVRHWVQARATHTAVAGWGVQGERSHAGDTRTFRYDQKDFWNKRMIDIFVFLPYTAAGWCLILAVGWHLILRPTGKSFFAGAWHSGDFWGSLISATFLVMLLMGGAFFVNIPLLVFLSGLPEMIEARKRRAERITTRQSGIMFEDGKRQISANWNEVTGYFLQPSAYSRSAFFRVTAFSSSRLEGWRWVFVVETTQGSFEYSWRIEGNKELGKIIEEHALPLKGRKAPPLPVGSEAGRV